MHNIKLWSPNNKKTNLHKFINQLNKSLNIKNYADLHNWSINHKNEFWSNVWDFTNFVGEKKGKIFKSAPEFTKNINLDIPSIPACLSLHNIDVIVRVRSLKEDQKKN